MSGILSLDGGGAHTGTFENSAGATLNFGGGGHVLAAGSMVTGAGAVSVSGNATTLTASGAFDVTRSTLNLASGTATLAAGCIVSGTTLNLGGGVLNSASFSPGLPLGELDISGNYQQTASGVLHIELGGYSPGTEFDLVTVTAGGAGGIASLGGTLNVTLTNNFFPTNGATFTFLTALSSVGNAAGHHVRGRHPHVLRHANPGRRVSCPADRQ